MSGMSSADDPFLEPKDMSHEIVLLWERFYKQPDEDQIDEICRLIGTAKVRDMLVDVFDELIVQNWLEVEK